MGATATYVCFSAYRLVGMSVRTCASNGTWSSSTVPVCQRKDMVYMLSVHVPVAIIIEIACSDLPSLVNGNIDYSGAESPGSRPVDTVATYTCNSGYTLNGSSTRTCRSDGNDIVWSRSAPICQRK